MLSGLVLGLYAFSMLSEELITMSGRIVMQMVAINPLT